MYTKLYIPYNVDSTGKDDFLLVFSKQSVPVLTQSLVGKLLIKNLTEQEWITLFWLGERSKPLVKAKIYYLLTLRGNTPKKIVDLYSSLIPEVWTHLNLDKVFPSLRGDLKSQAARLAKQLDLRFRKEKRESPKPRELRWMGIGYRDKGSLNHYKFNWKDYDPGEVQVIYQDLFARLTDQLVSSHIERARFDLRTFSRVRVTKKKKPSEEAYGKSRNPEIPRIKKVHLVNLILNSILEKLSPL